MNELQRIAYLEAIGVDGYVSRQQLPGAAPTRRLAVVRSRVANAQVSSVVSTSAAKVEVNTPDDRGEFGKRESPLSALLRTEPQPPQSNNRIEALPAANKRIEASEGLQFQLVVTVAGQYVWVEDLGAMPLRSEQVWLVEAMAQALQLIQTVPVDSNEQPANVKAEVIYFNWPLHNNPQFENGVDAARAAVTGFVERVCEKSTCLGVVLLGEGCSQWLPELSAPFKSTKLSGSAEMLADTSLKREAWRHLLSLNAAGT